MKKHLFINLKVFQFKSIKGLLSVWLLSTFIILGFSLPAFSWNGNFLMVDGAGDYANLLTEDTVDVATDGTESFTVEAWISPTYYGCIIGDDAYDLGYVRHNGADAVKFSLWLGETHLEIFRDTILFNEWHHVVGMFDNLNNRAAIGIDGSIAWFDNIDDDDGLWNGAWPLTVGAFSASDGFLTGKIDEVRISNDLRYTGNSYTLPSAPFSSDSNTLALWHFDESAGATSFADASGNGRRPLEGRLRARTRRFVVGFLPQCF